jgi:hypothetical protein
MMLLFKLAPALAALAMVLAVAALSQPASLYA